jgi:uncharacterized protein
MTVLWKKARQLTEKKHGDTMVYFLVTFVFMLVVVAIMAIGVAFGRRAIKGSCGGASNGNCVCVEKCAKRKKMEAEGHV